MTTRTGTAGSPPPEEVARLMAAMAGGDVGALCEFVARCGQALAAVVCRALLSFGRFDVARNRAEIDEIVLSAGLAVFDRAGSWSAEGAPPWVWAERAIRHEVVAHLGNPSVELGPVLSARAASADAADAGVVVADHGGSVVGSVVGSDRGLGASLRAGSPYASDFEAVAERHPAVGLLREAIASVGTARDQRVHIEYRIQKSLGDASPARTVAAEFGLRPDNVRQIDRRMRVRLEQLIEDETRFGSLRDLAWLAT